MFGDNKPKVSEEELKKAKQELFSQGVDKRKLDQVDKVFHGHMDEPGNEHGIDSNEITAGTGFMREHKKDLGITDKDIDNVEKDMRKKL